MNRLKHARSAIGIALLVCTLSIAGCTLLQSASTVGLEATPTTGEAPLRISFTPTVEGTATSYAWDFGDGVTSEDPSPTHIYRASGTYTVSLTVHLSDGSVAHVTRNDLIDITGVMTTTARNSRIVWLDRSAGTIFAGPRSGGTPVTVFQAALYPSTTIRAIAVAHGKVYWTTYDSVKRCNLDGSDHQVIYRSNQSVGCIAIDASANKVYWTEDALNPFSFWITTGDKEIWQANLDGSGATSWANSHLSFDSGQMNYAHSFLAVDSGNSRLYWTSIPSSTSARMQWTPTDSVLPQEHTPFWSLPQIGGIAVDHSLPGGIPNIYWTNPSKNQIWSGYAGVLYHSRDLLITTPHPKAIAVDAFAGKIYWSSDNGIYRANLQDGSDVQLIYPGVHADALALAN